MAGLLSPNEMFNQMFLGNQPDPSVLVQMNQVEAQAGRNIGKNIGLLAANKLFGVPLTNPEIEQQRDLYQILGQTDLQSPESLAKAAQQAMQLGNPEVAFKLLELANQYKTTQARLQSKQTVKPITPSYSPRLYQLPDGRVVEGAFERHTKQRLITNPETGQLMPLNEFIKKYDMIPKPFVGGAPQATNETNKARALAKALDKFLYNKDVVNTIARVYSPDIGNKLRDRNIQKKLGMSKLVSTLKDAVEETLGSVQFRTPSSEELDQITNLWNQKINEALGESQDTQQQRQQQKPANKRGRNRVKPRNRELPRKKPNNNKKQVLYVDGVKVEVE